MKVLKKTFCGVLAGLVIAGSLVIQPGVSTKAATTDDVNGDWSAKNVTLKNTPEAQLMVRVGDIDNFGYSWGTVDPFTGKETSTHGYPYKPNSDPAGTDRIMVVSGYTGGGTTDGYTSSTYGKTGYTTTVSPVTLQYDLTGITVQNAYIQMFVDDVQPSKWQETNTGKYVNVGRGGFSCNSYNQYEVTLSANGVTERIPAFETVVNNLDQHGPIGKMITLQVPTDKLDFVRKGGSGLQIKLDDPRKTVKDINGKDIKNTGDGYAIDFVKLLVNKNVDFSIYNATIQGTVYEASYNSTGQFVLDKNFPVSGAKVTISGVGSSITTNSNGVFSCNTVPAGQVVVTIEKTGYKTRSYTLPLVEARKIYSMDFGIINLNPSSAPEISLSTDAMTNQDVTVTVRYRGTPYKKYYKIGATGTVQEYTAPFTVSGNCTVYAYSTDRKQTDANTFDEIKSLETNKVIGNIDKINPTGETSVTISADRKTGTISLVNLSDNYSSPDKITVIKPTEFSNTVKDADTGKDKVINFIVENDKIYTKDTGVEIGSISADGKTVTTKYNLKYDFTFKDEAGNVGGTGDSQEVSQPGTTPTPPPTTPTTPTTTVDLGNPPPLARRDR